MYYVLNIPSDIPIAEGIGDAQLPAHGFQMLLAEGGLGSLIGPRCLATAIQAQPLHSKAAAVAA